MESAFGDPGSGLVELASGIDALYLSGRGQLGAGVLEGLAVAKEHAGELGCVLPFAIGEEQFALGPGGFHRYAYRLEHEFGVIGVTPSENLPTFRIQPRSQHLHSIGPEGAVEWWSEVVSRIAEEVRFVPNRVDVYADFQGCYFPGLEINSFVRRAVEFRRYGEHGAYTGMDFGTRGGGTVFNRIYDKTLEIRVTGHDWLEEVWGDRYERDKPVVRVEFQFGRKGLREFGITTVGEALDAIGDLWRYGTCDWLTLRSASSDATRSRWPIAPEWLVVQQASLGMPSVGITRARAGRLRGELRLLLPLLNGAVAGFGARVGTVEIEDTLSVLRPYLREYERSSGRRFRDRVAAKRLELGESA